MRDLVIIGAGPGGYDTAIAAKQQGLDVVLIEADTVGGTCLNWGCIPTKALYHNATQLTDILHADVFGISVSDVTLDFDVVTKRKRDIVSSQVQNIQSTLKRLNIELIEGMASIVDPHTVRVNDIDISTNYIIIATGSSSRPISFTGDSLPIIQTSKELLSHDTIPKRMLVVGAGVIGMEMASIYNAFGSEITVVEYQPNILPFLDKDIIRRARNLFKRRGINMHTSAKLVSVTTSDEQYLATVETKKGLLTIPTDYVLLATGRTPNFGGLDLERLGIDYDQTGITVNEHKQTNIPSIYAIGDVNGELMLAHKATYDGYKALAHIQQQHAPIRFDLVPSIVFSIPEIATVGVTQQQSNQEDIDTVKFMYKTNAKAHCMNKTEGFIKLVVDANDTIIGCHIIGAHAADLIHEVSAMMTSGITVSDYKHVIHAHPTLSELIGEALKDK